MSYSAGAAGAVNRYLTLRNWFIGAYIVEFEQNGEDRASYGQRLLSRLARDPRPATHSSALGWTGVALCLLGFGLAINARRHLGRNWGLPMACKG